MQRNHYIGKTGMCYMCKCKEILGKVVSFVFVNINFVDSLQNKLLEEEEKEKREEQERRMRRRTKEREKKHRRKERLKEKERDKGKRDEFKTSDDISSSTLSNSSTCTNDESGNTFGSRAASEEEDNSTAVALCHAEIESSCIEIDGQNNIDCCDTVTKCPPVNSSEPFTSQQSKPSRRNLRLRKDVPQDHSSCWYDDGRDESRSVGNMQWRSMERMRNGDGSCNSVCSTNNRTR